MQLTIVITIDFPNRALENLFLSFEDLGTEIALYVYVSRWPKIYFKIQIMFN